MLIGLPGMAALIVSVLVMLKLKHLDSEVAKLTELMKGSMTKAEYEKDRESSLEILRLTLVNQIDVMRTQLRELQNDVTQIIKTLNEKNG